MEGVPAQLMGNGMWSAAQSSTFRTPTIVKELAYQNVTQNNGIASISRQATISEFKPNAFSQVKGFVNNVPEVGIGTGPGMIAVSKFAANIVFNVINDATATVTGLIKGPESAVNAEGTLLNRAEFTDAGMNTLINLAPTPDKFLKVPGVKLNAAEFSSLHKGTEVLTKAKSEVGSIIKQTNNATIGASEALTQSSQAVNSVSAAGNVKQQIDLKKKEDE